MKTEFQKDRVIIGELLNQNIGMIASRDNEVIKLGHFFDEKIVEGFQIHSDERYMGEFNDGRKNGIGYSYSKSFNYLGEFNNNWYHGLGILTQYINSKKNGLSLSETYIGEFKNSNKSGLGSENFYEYYISSIDTEYINDIRIYGLYKNNKKIGPFISVFNHVNRGLTIHEILYFIDDKISMGDEIYLNLHNLENSYFIKQGQEFGNCKMSNKNEIIFGSLKNSYVDGLCLKYMPNKNELKIGLIDKGEFLVYFELELGANIYGNLSLVKNMEQGKVELFNNGYCEGFIFCNKKIILKHEYNSTYFEFYNNNKLCFEIIDYKSFNFNSLIDNLSYNLYFDSKDIFIKEIKNELTEIICLNDILNISIYDEPSEIFPMSHDINELNHYDNVHVPYKIILESFNEGINCLEPYYLVIDTETNGLPREHLSDNDLNKWPRIIEIAYLQFSKNGTLLRKYSNIIKPDNFIIVDNHISQISNEKALNEGEDLEKILDYLNDVISDSKVIVGHNIDFDINVILSEFERYKIKTDLDEKGRICTMKKSLTLFFNGKFPKLQELYYLLYKDKINNAHTAMSDANATSQCFWKLKEMKII
jgi:DNA polymerase-3 subunit epsilon